MQLQAPLLGVLASVLNTLQAWTDGIPGKWESLWSTHHTFDYVVVGGGTAGVTVAARLAEQNFKVALVEAGYSYEIGSPTAVIPGAASLGVGSSPGSTTAVDWHFVARAVPGANHRDIHYPRGKCLGGSSALNFMAYQRPTRDSMQRWADLVQDQSYTFDNVLPYFKKTAHFTPPNEGLRAPNATAQYNRNAFDRKGNHPLHVSYPAYAMPFSSWMKLGLKDVGMNETNDFNSGHLSGSQYCSFTIRPSDQTRSSSETAFLSSLNPLSKTLKIYKGTMANRILFDSRKRATGVQVSDLLQTFTLNARREIIISAGVFHSPQLLMVSGIGPADTLEELDIDIIRNAPGVGQNMWDHVFFGPTYQVAVETYTKVATDLIYFINHLLQWVSAHSGVLTNPIIDYIAFEKLSNQIRANFSESTVSDLSWFPDDWPEIEYLSAAAYVGDFSKPLLSQPSDGKQYATILGTLVAPTSRGNVTIISADTSDLPVINPNWLSTETDQQVAIAAYRRIRAMFQSAAMAPIVVGTEYFPGSQYETDVEILEVIQNTVMTIYHAACTCKMGTRDDPMAVLDSRARVFGVKGLRVVDASAFPILVPGHPQSTVYMLAEKIAADIASSSLSDTGE
ncbi:GMC family oxidoreductase [Aspergillus clavatus NRRL 1]|uniref:GMC oxidoreductase, putative n=1 Tax=Aspergillus clavatus (strain ATCC 1007 / CBS 513.65 / DSM 816 / NCTC 3887 / NRRL 1 / QM 1276 / 107) TaxID=344612 RepID=A1C742_ASPCL|nr:GMC oxidoreductase, putative [Aspergillus clavatus NRRL 1]EAW14213.1 GMC oxidoreductase, putative [Aspergillus clavatus NRRL 1]